MNLAEAVVPLCRWSWTVSLVEDWCSDTAGGFSPAVLVIAMLLPTSTRVRAKKAVVMGSMTRHERGSERGPFYIVD